MTAPVVDSKSNDGRKKAFYKRNRPANDQMASKLSELFKISQSNETRQAGPHLHVSTRSLPPLIQESVDGVDHINFFTDVQTELGALLSTENRLPFVFGTVSKDNQVTGETFESLKCLWAFYRTSCTIDGFRNAQDFKIRKFYRAINEFPKQESIFAIMVMAYYCKMLAYRPLADALVNCKLPFDYYSVRDGVKRRTAVSKLMINALYEVKRALKNRTLPRLDSFLSMEDQGKAKQVLPVYRHDFIVDILLSPETFRKSYQDSISNWTEEQLEKLAIDLSSGEQRKQALRGGAATASAMDESATLLAIPTEIDDAGERKTIPVIDPNLVHEANLEIKPVSVDADLDLSKDQPEAAAETE